MNLPTSAQHHQIKDIQHSFAAQAIKFAALATVCVCVCFCWWGLPCTFISIALGVKVSGIRKNDAMSRGLALHNHEAMGIFIAI